MGPEGTWKAVIPVAFVIISLLALAALPIVVSSRTSRIQGEITRLAEPARRAASQIQLDLSAELHEVIAFQVTGQQNFRAEYASLVNDQRRDYIVLRRFGPKLSPQVTKDLDALIANTQEWHADVDSAEFLKRRLPSEVYTTRLFERHPEYDRALKSAAVLQTDIQSAGNERLARIHDVERLNTAVSVFLSLLALVSALLVAEMGRQMRLLAAEATRRRKEAEREAGEAKSARETAETEERRAAFLANAAQELTSSLDFTRAVGTLAHLMVPNLADACAIDLVEDGELRRAAIAHRDEARENAMRREIGQPILNVPEMVSRVIRDREPHVAGPSEQLMSFMALPGERLSVMAIPLVSRGEALGVLTAAAAGGKTFSRADADFAAELARNGSLAIDNAKLYLESQQAVSTREQVLAIVSHDLRNPLNAVNLAASLMKTSASIHLSAEDREQLDIIELSVKRMSRLIEDLLDVTRLEGGKRLPLVPAPIEVASIIQETYELFKVQALPASITLNVDVPDDLPPLFGDRHRVLQVFSNIIGNALKFTPEGGRIDIRARRQDGMIRFSVADTGPGIAKEDLNKIFNPYWQATRTERMGAGLGLPISRGIVEAHGGQIWVESEPGRGTTFHFTLPISVEGQQRRTTDRPREESPAHR